MGFKDLWWPIDVIGCHFLGKRFIGAQNVSGVLKTGECLKDQGFKMTYNLLGEHVKDEKTVDAAVDTTLALIDTMNPRNCGNVSCKPTLYGLAISKELFLKKMTPVIEQAFSRGIEVEFDAESYEYIPDTFEVFSSFASRPVFRNIVRQAVQAHLSEINRLMREYKLWNKNLRIVKGSGVYIEDPSIVLSDPSEVNENYLNIFRKNLKTRRVPFVATVRDRKLAEEIIKASERGRFPFEFQFLYGPLGKSLRKKLLERGYPVRIYVPFTDKWCEDVWKSYGLRRAQMIRRMLLSEFLTAKFFTA